MQPLHYISVQEYLELDRQATASPSGVKKYEYHAGELYAMAGVSWEHAQITRNVARTIESWLDIDRCTIVTSDMRVQVGADFTYPDVILVCGEAELTDDRPPSVQNPQLIVEVLSDSTRDRDKDWKMQAYLQIPSLKEYWIVEQTESLVLQYYRTAEEWGLRILSGARETLISEHLELEIQIREFYRGLTLF